MKRVFTFFCALCLLVSCFTVMPMKVEAAAVSQSQAVDWLWTQVGKTHGTGQCVNLIQSYYRYLGVPVQTDNADGYGWNWVPAGWERILSNYIPQPGDIAVWKANVPPDWTGPLAHVSVVVSGNADTFTTIHQNWKNIPKCVYTDNLNTSLLLYCVIRPNFSTAAYENLGNDFYAKIKNRQSGNALCSVNGNVELGKASAAAALWHFVRQSDGSYKIYDRNGRLMGVQDESTANGTNVAVYTTDTNSPADRWYLTKSASGAYCLYSALSNRVVLTLTGGQTTVGTNACMYTNDGSVFSKLFSISIEKDCNHSYKKTTQQPTCTKAGKYVYTCTICGDSYSKSIPATGHSYGSWYTVKAATCTSGKVTERKCSACSGKQTSYTSALGHSYKNGQCSRCGAVDPNANVAKITTQPKNVATTKGKTAKVTIKATGEGLKYQWYYAKKGSSSYKKISGATKSSLSVKMSSSYNGCKVYCVVKDKYGTSVKSKVVTLSMRQPAKITTQPKKTAVYAGSTAKFSIKASGDGLSYTWYYAKKGAKKYTKASDTDSIFELKASSSYNGCKVYCVVKDQYGNTVKSKVVTLTVKNKVKITTQPKSVTAVKNKTAKVTVKATGDGLKYQWYYAKKGSSSYKKLSGATKASYSVKMTSSVNGRKVYCKITDKYGNSVKSAVVTLSVKQTAKITTQPKSVKVAEGKTAKFTLKAAGDGLKYTWYYAENGASEWVESSANTNTISVKAAAKWNGYRFMCVVKDKYGNTVKSKVVTLTVQCKAKITAQPKSVSAENGKTATVTVKATGDGLKYQWYYANKGSSSYKKISGATKASYSVKMTSSVNGRKVYCKITDKYGNSVKSSVATLSMIKSVPSEYLSLVKGSWTAVYGIEKNGSVEYAYEGAYWLDIDDKGTAYIFAPFMDREREFDFTIEFVTKAGNLYCYRMKDTKASVASNGFTLDDDGVLDLTYDPVSDTVSFKYDDGCSIYLKRHNW